jgi:lipopolysaccharide transport system permease protein
MSITTSKDSSTLQPAAAAPSLASTSYNLPEEPLTTIRPSGAWSALDLRDLWAYRELLYFLTWRDLKVRYKQTWLGVLWVVLQPLMMTLIFTVFLGMLVRVPSDGFPYALFVYVGLLPWTFFSSAVTGSGNSLIANSHLITKVYFPRLIVPTSAVAGRLVDFSIAFLILVGMLLYYRVALTWNVLLLVPLIALTTLLALGCGMLLSALNVKYRDIGIALPVMIQLWMYVSPVLYPSRLISDRLGRWSWLYSLNPLVGLVDGFRFAVKGGTFNRFALGVSAVVTLVMLVYSAYMFRRVEKSFADII